MAYTGQDFAREITMAMDKGKDAHRYTAEAVQKALESPNLFDGYEQELSSHLEFHMLQTPQAAIKVFVMHPDHPLGPPHDHAGLWGCYATYSGRLMMDFYREKDESGTTIEEVENTHVEKGTYRFIGPDAIHRVWVKEPSNILTIYNGDLNSSIRRIYDLENRKLIRDISRWEERMAAKGGQGYEL